MRRRDAGITLVEVTAAVTVAGIVLALLLPAMARSSRVNDVLACRGHLKTLYEAQLKAPAPGPKEYGRAYWQRLATSTPPLVSAETLRCPLVDVPDAPPVHYCGPAGDLSKYGEKDPIGCDFEHNHSDDGKQGGNVLLKSGAVATDHTGIWGTALRSGKCRP
jgi:hypothetical protein